MKSPLYHIKNAHKTFEHFHNNLHHAFVVFVLAMIGMLRGASHIFTPSSASWLWGGFLTADFWEQNPSDANVMYALFGDGTPGDTAYTRLWSTSCVPTSVVYTGSFSGGTLAANTIYVINSGTYTLTSPITMNGNCSALIGRGDVYVKQSGGNSMIISGSTNNIIDNINFNGQNLSSTGIYINNSSNIMFNNIEMYKYTGTTISGTALGAYNGNNNKVFINNSDFYNNDIGIKSSLNITINNSKFYNNMLGLNSTLSTNTINNSQFLNNSIGVYNIVTNGAMVS